MRQALVESIGGSTQEGFSAGTIVVCVSCGKPIYRIERFVGVGSGLGRNIDAFAPVLPRDLVDLLDRRDVDAGIKASVRAIDDPAEYCDSIERPRKHDGAVCPKCGLVFVQLRSAEHSDTLDQAYVWELSTVPPFGQRQIPLTGGAL